MNDAGKVAFTPKGDYSNAATYEYLDTVVYNGNAYAALKTTTGNAPTDSDTDENWKLLARGGTSVPIATEKIAGVVKAGSDVGVSDTGDMVLKTDFTEQKELAELTSGENRSTFFGKIAKAVADFISHKSTKASTTDYGHTILEDSIDSTSTDKAATSASVKKAYDLANKAVPTANISQSSAITETGTYVLDAVEKNASVEGTIAHDIAELNSNLNNKANTSTVTALQTSVNTINSKLVAGYVGKSATFKYIGAWASVDTGSFKLMHIISDGVTPPIMIPCSISTGTSAFPYVVKNNSGTSIFQYFVAGTKLYVYVLNNGSTVGVNFIL